MPYDSHTDTEQLKTPSQASETKEDRVNPPTSPVGLVRGEIPYQLIKQMQVSLWK